jgi:replicative DNA helicase
MAAAATTATLAVATFKHARDNEPRQHHLSWDKLTDHLMRHQERDEKDGPLWSPTLYRPDTTRGKANVEAVSCLVLDFDKGTSPTEFTRGWDTWAYVAHTTFQHTEEQPRWRIAFPLSAPISGAEWPAAWECLVRHFGSGQVDSSCRDASRIYYLPACPPGAERDAWANEGRWLDVEELFRPSVARLIDRARGELHSGRNNAGLWLACQMRDNGYTQSETEAARWDQEVPREKHDPSGRVDEYTAAEWQETVRKVFASGQREPWGFSSNGTHAEARQAHPDWEDPLPLYAVALPEFPVSVLPVYIAEMVASTAEATQTPPDLAAMLSLSVLATAAQKRMEALVREGWREVLSLWTVSALPPGNRKSHAYGPMVAPVVEFERLLVERMRGEIAETETEYEVMEGALKRCKDQAIKARNEFDRNELTRQAVTLAEKLSRMPRPKPPRMIADDATPEELGRMLAANAGRMAIISDEGDIFDLMAGKYASGGANIGIYLRGHSGSDVLVDRVGRSSVVVRRAAITFGLCVQPDALLGLTANATFKGRGLLGRFLYAVPTSTLGGRNVRPRAIPAAVSETYGERMTFCLALPADQDENGNPCPNVVAFDAEADDEVAAFEAWIEPQLAPSGSLGYMADWAGKLTGQLVRIAALIHLAELAGTPEPWRMPVDGETVAKARTIAEYLIPHARAAFQAMGTDPAINNARLILEWIRKQGAQVFSKRDAFNGMRSQFDRAAALDEPLVVLIEHGHIRQLPPEKREGPGQPPSPKFRVHPSLLTG